MNATLSRWLGQPTTIMGIGIMAGAAAGIGTLFATHGDVSAATAVGGPVAGAVLMAMRDNSADRSAAEKVVGDVIAAAGERRITPAVIADVGQVLTPSPVLTAVPISAAALAAIAGDAGRPPGRSSGR